MARAHKIQEFRIMHRIKFQSLIRDHHVYKNVWSPYVGETLVAHPDDREEAREYDKYAIGIYKKNMDCSEELVGHAPVELSSLLYHFLQASSDNCINVRVIGKRKREIGLVVPAKYDALTKSKEMSMVLDKELSSRKNLYKSYLELKHQQKKI